MIREYIYWVFYIFEMYPPKKFFGIFFGLWNFLNSYWKSFTASIGPVFIGWVRVYVIRLPVMVRFYNCIDKMYLNNSETLVQKYAEN